MRPVGSWFSGVILPTSVLALFLFSSGSLAVKPSADERTTLLPGFEIADGASATSTYSFHGSAVQQGDVIKLTTQV